MVPGSGSGVRLAADWLRVIDAAHEPVKDLATWGGGVLAAAKPVLGGVGTVLHMIRHTPAGTITDAPLVCSDFPSPMRRELLGGFGPEGLRALYYPPSIVTTHGALRRHMDTRTRAAFRAFSESSGIVDAVGLVVHPAPGAVMVLQNVLPDEVTLSARERRSLTWLGLHLEAAMRLRLRPEALRAVMGPSGRLEHRGPSCPPKAELDRAVRAVQGARRRRHHGAEALGLWRALVAGELSVVERVIGSRTHYFFLDNPPHRQPFTALTPKEQDAVSAICRSQLNKAAAYELGISEAALSRRMDSATAKVGLASRMELVRLAAMLVRDPRARFADLALTPSEEHVLELLGRGLSNADIAAIRSRSVRTIANQVAALLRKSGAHNRRALVAHHAQEMTMEEPATAF